LYNINYVKYQIQEDSPSENSYIQNGIALIALLSKSGSRRIHSQNRNASGVIAYFCGITERATENPMSVLSSVLL
jgi:hypothetical protein